MDKTLRGALPPVCVLALILLLFAAALAYPSDARQSGGIQHLTEWRLDGEAVSLPLTLNRLSPRTPLTLTAEVQQPDGAYLYLKTVYAPLRVYANEELIFEYGQPGSYPGFLLDPPTKAALVPLPGGMETAVLRMEFRSPAQRGSVTLHPVLLGTSAAILTELFRQMGFSLFLSFTLLALGLLLFLIALVLTRFERAGTAFFWLGVFCICVSSWVFGECNLSGVLINAPVFLYLLAFLGLFTAVIPILKFGRAILGLRENGRRLLDWSSHTLEAGVGAAVLLQLLGAASFSKTMYLFHVIEPLALCVFAAVLLVESARYQNSMARKFLIPTAALAVFALLEAGNYYLFRLPVQNSFFFQVGVLIFIVLVSIVGGCFVRDAFSLREQNTIMQRQIQIQKEQYRLLLSTEENEKKLRHSVKHHLAAMRVLLMNREPETALADLNAMLDNLSADVSGRLCNNPLVNAAATHYQAIARQAGVDISIHLDIPEDTGRVPDGELCVIVGDLLENAVAACRETDKPFIRMRSRCADGLLTVTMDNSFSHIVQRADGSFQSTREGGGLGLRVIAALAEKHHGGSRFEARDGVFYSSVYLRLL